MKTTSVQFAKGICRASVRGNVMSLIAIDQAYALNSKRLIGRSLGYAIGVLGRSCYGH